MQGKRGQSSAEFVLIMGAILVVVIAVMGRAYAENELSVAFAAARLGASESAAANSSLSFAALDYSIQGRNVTLKPMLFQGSAPIADSAAVRAAVLRRIRDSLSPGAADPSGSFSTFLHDYSVAFP